jgi:hypothetical protein
MVHTRWPHQRADSSKQLCKLRHFAQQAFEERQRQSRPGQAVGFGRDFLAQQMRHVAAGCVAVKHLQQEALDGRDRIEFALAPAVTKLAAHTDDERRVECSCDVRLDLFDGLRDIAKHAWASWAGLES